jgi:transcriptional regulatory protein RtcR
MATLADGGRIDDAAVAAEIARLGAARNGTDDGLASLLGARADELDRFDRVQLADVVAACASAPSLSAAGRVLFARSLAHRATRNDADRLRKYLARFGLDFDAIRARTRSATEG